MIPPRFSFVVKGTFLRFIYKKKRVCQKSHIFFVNRRQYTNCAEYKRIKLEKWNFDWSFTLQKKGIFRILTSSVNLIQIRSKVQKEVLYKVQLLKIFIFFKKGSSVSHNWSLFPICQKVPPSHPEAPSIFTNSRPVNFSDILYMIQKPQSLSRILIVTSGKACKLEIKPKNKVKKYFLDWWVLLRGYSLWESIS